MSDSSAIHSLISDEEYDSSLNSYTDSQIEYMNDINNGSYSSSSIFFDTAAGGSMSKWICWRDATLVIPINITSSGTAYDATRLLAFKSSILNLISGVQVSTSGGQTIVSDNNVSIINGLRLLVEKELEWFTSEGARLMFAKDSITTPSSTAMGGTTPVNTTASNSGFLTRIQLLKQQAAGTTSWSCQLSLPLRYLHDFFDKLNFPMTNNRFQFSFSLNLSNSSPLPPMVVDSVQVSAAAVPPPVITIGSASSNGVSLTSCRIYYNSVKFSPELNQKLVAKLNSGYSKKIFFRVTDSYLPGAGETAQTTGSINKLVSASTIHPLRLWLLCPPTTALSTQGSDTVNGCFVFPGGFSNCNVLINNTQYYQNNLSTLEEQWQVLSEQFPGAGSSNKSGSLLSFSDFVNTYRLHCFDVSRAKDRLRSPNESVSIQVVGTRSNATSCDYYFLVERLQAVNFHFSSAETRMVVGL